MNQRSNSRIRATFLAAVTSLGPGSACAAEGNTTCTGDPGDPRGSAIGRCTMENTAGRLSVRAKASE